MPHNFEGRVGNNFNNFPPGSISIFCDPAAFSSLGQWPEILSEENIWGAFGCHPHNAKYYNDSMVDRFVSPATANLRHSIVKIFESTPKAIAWGECGLDYKKNLSSHEDQRRAFADQVALYC